MSSVRDRGGRQRLLATQHTGQSLGRGFLIPVLSGLCRGRQRHCDLHSLLGQLVRVSRGDFLTLVRSESSMGDTSSCCRDDLESEAFVETFNFRLRDQDNNPDS